MKPIALLALLSLTAAAQEIVPWPHRDDAAPLTVSAQTADVRVRDQVAELTLAVTFHNPNAQELEGMFLMKVPADAQVSKFAMTVNGKEQQAELLDAKKAREIYDQIVNARRDPGLLELAGHGLIKASVYPIPAKGDVKVQLGYTVALAAEGGLVNVVVPFARNRGDARPIEKAVVNMTIESRTPIKSVYSPTHAVAVSKKDDRHATVSFEATKHVARGDLSLYYALSEDDIGLSLLTFREPGEDGFFLLLASPKVDVAKDKVLPKDVIFVIDRSGSMSGEKIRQAREALVQCLNGLHPADRLNIVDFSSEVGTFQPGLVEAAEFRGAAVRYAEAMQARGSTNIDGALKAAGPMFQPDPRRLAVLLFMTDGLPTVGEQNTEKILENARAAMPKGVEARIFVFGVGHDVNTQFLDRLAEQGHGARDYVAPEERIEEKMGLLFEKIANPVLASLALDFGGARVQEMYPKHLPDLFKGQQLTLFGRYRAGGPAAITLRGMAAGEDRVFRYEVNFPEKDVRCDFLPRLWAGRKVAFLIDAIRLGGNPSQEVIDEIVALGKRYGIVTPYTSFLITEDDATAMRGRAGERLEELRKAAAAPGAPAEKAQADSKVLQEQKKGDRGLDDLERDADEIQREQGGGVRLKSVGSRTFYRRGGVWTDGAYDEKDKDRVVKVKFLSDEYKKLIADNAGIEKYLAVGESVIVCFGGKIYHVEK